MLQGRLSSPLPLAEGQGEGHTPHLAAKRQDRACRRPVQPIPGLNNGS